MINYPLSYLTELKQSARLRCVLGAPETSDFREVQDGEDGLERGLGTRAKGITRPRPSLRPPSPPRNHVWTRCGTLWRARRPRFARDIGGLLSTQADPEASRRQLLFQPEVGKDDPIRPTLDRSTNRSRRLSLFVSNPPLFGVQKLSSTYCLVIRGPWQNQSRYAGSGLARKEAIVPA